MSNFNNRDHISWSLKSLLGLIASIILFCSFSLNSIADSSSTSTIAHTHRGDSSAGGSCYETPIYSTHNHAGNSSSGGGCYGASRTVYTSHVHSGCPETMVPTCRHIYGENGGWEGTNACPNCRHSHPGGVCTSWSCQSREYTCNNQPLNSGARTVYDLNCGKTAGTRYESEGIESYALSCSLSETDYGSISFTNSTSGWTSGNVTLQGEFSDPSGIISAGGYGALSFGVISGAIISESGNSIEVSENGTYSMSLSVDTNLFDTASTEVLITVSNIDRTPPTITDVSSSADSWSTSSIVTVTAVDLQPDGSEGSGLSGDAYSYDGGATWTSSNTIEITGNQTLDIRVRDNCGNEASSSITISNIDVTGPEISFTTSETWYEDDPPRSFQIIASDSDVGLAEAPYSYDGGETWTSLNVTYISEPGDFTVYVKDALGNISTLTITNTADERPAPPEPENNAAGSGNGSGSGSGNNGDDTDNNGDSNDGNTDGTGNDDDGTGNDNDGTDNDKDSGNSKSLRGTGTHDDSSNYDDSNNNDGNNNNSSNNYYSDGTTSYNSPSSSDGELNNNLDINPEVDPSAGSRYQESEEYTQALPISSSSGGSSGDGNSASKPFYKTTAFKVAASTSGSVTGIGLLALIFLMLYSGGVVYSFDVNKFRILAVLPIHHSDRGHCINLSDEIIEKSYSSKYKLCLGPIFTKKHPNELINIRTSKEWIPLQIDRTILFELS